MNLGWILMNKINFKFPSVFNILWILCRLSDKYFLSRQWGMKRHLWIRLHAYWKFNYFRDWYLTKVINARVGRVTFQSGKGSNLDNLSIQNVTFSFELYYFNGEFYLSKTFNQIKPIPTFIKRATDVQYEICVRFHFLFPFQTSLCHLLMKKWFFSLIFNIPLIQSSLLCSPFSGKKWGLGLKDKGNRGKQREFSFHVGGGFQKEYFWPQLN